MTHIIYIRLPPDAKLAVEQSKTTITVECPHERIDEMCKWLRLTADSLDGRLSTSSLGYIQDVAVPAARARAFQEAIRIIRDATIGTVEDTKTTKHVIKLVDLIGAKSLE